MRFGLVELNDMFAVGEWVGGSFELDSWANAVQNRAGTFDFSLFNLRHDYRKWIL